LWSDAVPYATQADLEDRFGVDELTQLTDRVGSGMPHPAIVARALADADAEIDGYLASRYELPLATVPPMLVRVACDIARYRLWEDRASEEVRLRYEDARRMLESIARGMVSLGPPEANAAQALATMNPGNARVMTRNGTGGY
jgi:phage gp36-like protein